MTTGIYIHFNKTATQLAKEFSVEQFASKNSSCICQTICSIDLGPTTTQKKMKNSVPSIKGHKFDHFVVEDNLLPDFVVQHLKTQSTHVL